MQRITTIGIVNLASSSCLIRNTILLGSSLHIQLLGFAYNQFHSGLNSDDSGEIWIRVNIKRDPLIELKMLKILEKRPIDGHIKEWILNNKNPPPLSLSLPPVGFEPTHPYA